MFPLNIEGGGGGLISTRQGGLWHNRHRGHGDMQTNHRIAHIMFFSAQGQGVCNKVLV